MYGATFTVYSLLKTMHIVAATAAFGSLFLIPIYLQIAKRQETLQERAIFHQLRLKVERALVVPAMVITFFVGIMMTMDKWSFSATWISLGSLALIALFAISGAIVIPAERRAAELAREEQQSAYMSITRKLEVTAWVQIAIFCCAVLVMVAKPGM